MKKIVMKHVIALALSVTLLIGMLAAGLPAGAADVYEVMVGFDQAMVNDNGTVYLPLTTEDGKAIMDTYGDWTTAFGTIYVDGAEWPGTGYSITGNYFYMGGLGMNTISKIEIKAGTELTPDSTCLSTVPIVIKNDLTLVKTDGVWEEQTAGVEQQMATLGLVNVGADNTWELTVEDISRFEAQYYCVEATVDGVTGRIALEKSGDNLVIWPSFFSIGGISAAPAQNFTIAEGAILEPVDPNVSGWNTVVAGTQFVLSSAFSITNYNGTWSDTPIIEPLDLELTFNNINTTNDWAFSAAADTLPTANQWFSVPVKLDGTDRTVLMEYDVNASWFYVYHHCFWPTPNDDAALLPQSSLTIPAGTVLTPLSAPDMSAVIEGGQTYKLTVDVDMAFEDGAWTDKNAVPPVVVTPLDAELTFHSVNNANDWAFTVVANGLPTANAWYAVPVKLDGTDRTVLMEYDVNASWFYVYHHCFWPIPNDSADLLPQSNLTIPAGTVLAPLSTPDASTVIADGQTLKLTKAVSVTATDGEWVDDNLPKPTYTELTVDKMTVTGQGDQPQLMRSYFQLLVVDALPQAGAEWWNNYDVYDVTVTVDGTEMAAQIGGGGDAATLALYIPWATAEDAILANASEIVIKAGSKGRVGLEGVVFPSDLRIYNDNGTWKTDYDPAEDVDLSNAVQVGVTLDHVDGANRLYLSALMSDGSKIMDTYGDWTTAFGSIRMGTLNADGTYTWTEDPAMAWSISGSYFYLSALQLDMYDAVEIKKGTVLLPDVTCKSQNPIIIANDFRMVRDEWEEWVVDDEFTGNPDYTGKPNVPGSSNTGDNTKAPIAWIIVGVCAAALALCLVLGGKKGRHQ